MLIPNLVSVMKFLLLAALVAVALAQPFEISEKDLGEWESFKVEYMKSYEPEEEAKRMKIFAGHLKFIREHNAKYEQGLETYEVGVNKFADLTNEEFRAQMNGFRMPAKRTGKQFDLVDDVSASAVDWRKKGAVTPIKDQGQCGACWSFSTTGSLEGQWFLTNGTLVSLSEQNLVDCSRKQGNMGCDGGLMDDAFEYIKTNNGIDTEASYKYTAEDGKCHYKKNNRAATVSGYVDVTEGSESDLQTAVTKIGPVSVAMDASLNSFQLYKKGIYAPSGCSTTQLDHGVLAVGYGGAKKKAYWLIKNSWGTEWGMSGYFMMAKNRNNMCGVATMASYPTTTGKL